ncbi:hypothetical protein [Hyphomonas sp.]|uniref:hypothetical protein n=1 Tax=Hyphomonas sp. TaxID=87 RepID=UPI00391B15A7
MLGLRACAAVFAVLGLAGVAAGQSIDPVSQKAAVYMTYQSDVDEIGEKPFQSVDDINMALTKLGGHNPDQFTRGWISYSALIASQDPEFRGAVRNAESYYGRDAVLSTFSNSTGFARTLDGGNSAVGAALKATEQDLPRVYAAADRIWEQGYTLQSFGWGKALIRDHAARTSLLSTSQRHGHTASDAILAALVTPSADVSELEASVEVAAAVTGNIARAVRLPTFLAGNRVAAKPSGPSQERAANLIASVAAMRIIEAGEDHRSSIENISLDPIMRMCIAREQGTLTNCVGSMRTESDIPQCISNHALRGIASCIATASR